MKNLTHKTQLEPQATRCLPYTESGYSLVSILIAVAIAGVLLPVMSRTVLNVFNLQSKMSYESDFLAVKATIETMFSCQDTRDHMLPPCVVGMPVDIYGRSPKGNLTLLISSNPLTPTDTYGFKLRAICEYCDVCPGERRIKIEVYKKGKDALSNLRREWVDLFQGVPLGCDMET